MYPYLFSGTWLAVPTYYVFVSLASLVAALWFLRRSAAQGHSRLVAIDLSLVTLVGGFVGARLLHVIYEEPAYYWQEPLRVLQVWNGGFVYFGGLLGATFVAALFCDWKREAFWVWADLAAPPAALGYALGRVGCFFNGCCYGRESQLPWSVLMGDAHRHPTQLYATFWELGALGVLWWLGKGGLRPGRAPGGTFGLWLILHGIGRLIMEEFRADPRGPLLAGGSLGSWLSLALVGAGLALLLQHYVPSRTSNQE